MQVRDIMTRNPDACMPDTDLHQVARMMADDDVGAIPVVEDRGGMKPIGIVTDRDIVCRIIAKGLNPIEKTARDAMTSDPLTVSPEMDLEQCLRLMERSQIRRMLVVDDAGRCCGIVSQADVATRASSPDDVAELVRDVSQPTQRSANVQQHQQPREDRGEAGMYH
jgi:CBS domain-containing protein